MIRAIRLLGLAAVAAAFTVTIASAQAAPVEALIGAGHWKRARAAVQNLSDANPNDPEAFYLLARIKQAFGDLDGALSLAQKAVAAHSRNAAYHVVLGELYGQEAEHTSVFRQMGLARRFRQEEETAANLNSKNLDARFDLLEFDLQAPGIIGGGKDKAYAMAGEIGRINAAQGDLAQAVVAAHDKDVAKEESFRDKAVAADPRNYDALISLAKLYESDAENKFDLAEHYAREALQVDPGRGDAYAILAGVYANQQRAKELTQTLAQVDENDSDNLYPYYEAARILLLKGSDLARAENYFRKYLTEEPEAMTPPLAAAHWRLGQTLEKEGRKADAVGELQTALRLQPNFPEAIQELERLK